MSRCRCHSGRTYKRCCEPLHEGASPKSAEALMRSRFCAYAKGDVEYILNTTHPEGPHFQADTAQWRAEVERFCANTQFEGLRIFGNTGQGQEATVSFRAELVQQGQDASFSELSMFLCHDGRWLYHSGVRA